eukprot:GHVU01098676.1.p3 GENE.GHVU01098676.1~~GHVU01098676.1.p3  ORF type:complete len:106 (+),score=10.55 GHVU01098676.1:1546-1863(+)
MLWTKWVKKWTSYGSTDRQVPQQVPTAESESSSIGAFALLSCCVHRGSIIITITDHFDRETHIPNVQLMITISNDGRDHGDYIGNTNDNRSSANDVWSSYECLRP